MRNAGMLTKFDTLRKHRDLLGVDATKPEYLEAVKIAQETTEWAQRQINERSIGVQR